MKHRKIVTLTMMVGLAIAALWGTEPASAGQKVTLPLQRSQGVEWGAGTATFVDGALTIQVKDLKPSSVYTVWYANMEPKHEVAGVGPAPYMFKTDRKGAATFKAKLDQHPVGKWQMLVIIRHPTGDPADMQHKEDALWASLAKAEGKTAVNPCAAKNPCAAASRVDPRLVTRPAGTKLFAGKQAELLKLGEELWANTKLSTNGLSCQTCHRANAGFNPTFAQPYPHPVAMPSDQAGLKAIHADEMVQFCMVVPMAAKPLPWESKELAALTAHTLELQKTFKPSANPCALKNPSAPKNPCAANPCAPMR